MSDQKTSQQSTSTTTKSVSVPKKDLQAVLKRDLPKIVAEAKQWADAVIKQYVSLPLLSLLSEEAEGGASPDASSSFHKMDPKEKQYLLGLYFLQQGRNAEAARCFLSLTPDTIPSNVAYFKWIFSLTEDTSPDELRQLEKHYFEQATQYRQSNDAMLGTIYRTLAFLYDIPPRLPVDPRNQGTQLPLVPKTGSFGTTPEGKAVISPGGPTLPLPQSTEVDEDPLLELALAMSMEEAAKQDKAQHEADKESVAEPSTAPTLPPAPKLTPAEIKHASILETAQLIAREKVINATPLEFNYLADMLNKGEGQDGEILFHGRLYKDITNYNERLYLAGLVFLAMNKMPEASKQFEAISLRPLLKNQADFLYFSAIIQLKPGNLDETRWQFEEAISGRKADDPIMAAVQEIFLFLPAKPLAPVVKPQETKTVPGSKSQIPTSRPEEEAELLELEQVLAISRAEKQERDAQRDAKRKADAAPAAKPSAAPTLPAAPKKLPQREMKRLEGERPAILKKAQEIAKQKVRAIVGEVAFDLLATIGMKDFEEILVEMAEIEGAEAQQYIRGLFLLIDNKRAEALALLRAIPLDKLPQYKADLLYFSEVMQLMDDVEDYEKIRTNLEEAIEGRRAEDPVLDPVLAAVNEILELFPAKPLEDTVVEGSQPPLLPQSKEQEETEPRDDKRNEGIDPNIFETAQAIAKQKILESTKLTFDFLDDGRTENGSLFQERLSKQGIKDYMEQRYLAALVHLGANRMLEASAQLRAIGHDIPPKHKSDFYYFLGVTELREEDLERAISNFEAASRGREEMDPVMVALEKIRIFLFAKLSPSMVKEGIETVTDPQVASPPAAPMISDYFGSPETSSASVTSSAALTEATEEEEEDDAETQAALNLSLQGSSTSPSASSPDSAASSAALFWPSSPAFFTTKPGSARAPASVPPTSAASSTSVAGVNRNDVPGSAYHSPKV